MEQEIQTLQELADKLKHPYDSDYQIWYEAGGFYAIGHGGEYFEQIFLEGMFLGNTFEEARKTLQELLQ